MKVCDYISWYTKSERRVDESGGKTNDEYGGQIEVLACIALFFCSRRVYEPPPRLTYKFAKYTYLTAYFQD